MTDHIYLFKVYCKCCEKPVIEKVFLSVFIEPEIVWKTYLLLSGKTSYTCRECALQVIKNWSKLI